VRAVRTANARCAVVGALAALALLACSSSSSSDAPDPKCNTCDGNVAVSCAYDCKYDRPGTSVIRTDCGSMKCNASVLNAYECTYMGTVWTVRTSYVSCQ
jgi:hypothetical protein